MIKNKKILISGAGVAGLTLAYWLKRYGFSPVLIERGKALRTGGYKVDIRGVALEVVKRMDIYEEILAKHTHMLGASIVDKEGNLITEMKGEMFNLSTSEDLEIIRGDLCQILNEQLKDVECIFEDFILAISSETNGVRVEFQNHSTQLFDLVVGADGLHSNVRNLVFGDESIFIKTLGLCISIFTVPNKLNLDRWEIECSEGDRLVNLYSTGRNAEAKAAFLFTSKDFPRNQIEQQHLLSTTYSDIGWEIPYLISAMKNSPDFYFDSVSQVEMSQWFKGRIVLVGDAGYCASPVSGQGTSLALVGAYILAGEVASSSGDHLKAFKHYQNEMGAFVKKNQKLGKIFAKQMTKNRNNMVSWLQNQLMHLLPSFWVGFQTNRSVKRVNKAANALSLKNYEDNKLS